MAQLNLAFSLTGIFPRRATAPPDALNRVFMGAAVPTDPLDRICVRFGGFVILFLYFLILFGACEVARRFTN